MSEQKDRISAIVEGMVPARAMDENRDYLARGRSFSKTDTDELKRRCVDATRIWLRSFGATDPREMDDLTAELRLRHIDLPYESLESEFDAMRIEIQRNPKQGRAENLRHIKAFLDDLERPPN
jgi:hypothetical protein